jgi:AcrR family transcriptional regulator
MPSQSSASSRPRPGGRSARIRAAVLAATVHELGATGLAGLSLEAVARSAGVHKATLYRRWGDRDQLVLELMKEQATETVPVPDTGALRTDLIALAQAAVANAASPSVEPIVRAAIAEVPHSAGVARAAREFWEERLALDAKIIERATARGELPARTAARAVIETLLGALHLRLLITGEPADTATITSTVDLIISGLASAHPG